MSEDSPIYLFSYGTLQQPEVQEALFGRALETREDALAGYATSWLEIRDAVVIAQSGSDRHPIVSRTSDPDAVVRGSVMRLTLPELERADHYEVDDYERVCVTLASGLEAWVYLQRSASESSDVSSWDLP